MAEMILYRGKIAVVPEKTYSLEEMRKILKRLGEHPGVVVEIRKTKRKPSFLITIKTLSGDVWDWIEAIADAIGEEIRESVSGRGFVHDYILSRT